MTADTVISTILTNLAMPEERYHRSRDDATSAVEPFNLRHFLRSMMTNLHCCGYFLRERKVWLIEISLREAQLDDYALTVPSPVYCGYRLPGYDDIMSGQLAATTSPAGASSTRENLNRYTGSPPDYESDSDEDRDHRADENDDHEDTTTDRQGLVNGALTNGSGIIHQLDRSEITRTPLSESMDGPTSQPPEMVMLKRLGDELSSIVISSSLTTSSSSPRQHSAVASSSSPMDSPLTVTLGRSFTNDDDSTASTTSLPLFE
ncbi:hypothetical protein BGZ83_008461 [Gryganskiella cystojenkinii]|nr:hypothetical protein BGZ83_008461 [Gryganskiella cystojenkinii]